MTKVSIRKSKVLDNDKYLTEHFEEIVDKYAGGFVIIVNGHIVYTDKDGSPRELIEKVKTEYPQLIPLFFRVPYPHEFIALSVS